MQRAEQLRPLSRQHHLGLNLGLKAGQCHLLKQTSKTNGKK